MPTQTHFNLRNLPLGALLLPVLWLGICGIACQLCGAPRFDESFDGRVVQQFEMAEGLPSNWIHDVLQASDRYLWIATHNGVARFDGRKFTRFNRTNTPQLPANDARVLYESHDGALWIGTIGGLVQYTPGRPASFQQHEAFRGNSIHAIFEDSEHVLWIGTREGTWNRATDGEFVLQEAAPTGVKAFCQDQQGTLWLGADSGLYVRRDAGFEQFIHPRLPASSGVDGSGSGARVNALFADGPDVWIGANCGLLHISDGLGDQLGNTVGQRQVYDLGQVDGALYVATRHGLWRGADGNKFEKL
jgi:ligand-binding sensor domain-containing protein